MVKQSFTSQLLSEYELHRKECGSRAGFRCDRNGPEVLKYLGEIGDRLEREMLGKAAKESA